MFHKILVPTDLSEKVKKALEIASKVCDTDSCNITLLHVVETIEDDDNEEFQRFYEKLTNRAWKNTDEMIDGMKIKTHSVHKEVVYGKRVPEIVRFAHHNNFDLIVLSSHKIETVDSPDGWATISYRVAILAHCPVLMVK